MNRELATTPRFELQKYIDSDSKVIYLLSLVEPRLGDLLDFEQDIDLARRCCNYCQLEFLRPYTGRDEWNEWQIQEGSGVFPFDWGYVYEKLLEALLSE